MRAPAAPAGPGPRPRGAASRPPTRTSTAGPSGSSCRSSTPGTTPRPAGPARSPSWCRCWRRARARCRRRPRRADGRPWADLDELERRRVVDEHRLAYLSEAPVNWCPGLGTVLANEEVTADGRSERGNFPVFKRNLRQWMMRITAYADRLLDDLDALDWPESDQAACSATGSAAPRARGSTSPATAGGDRGLHHPAGHAVRRDLHGAGARAPAGRPADRRGLAGRRADVVDRRRGDAARRGRGLPPGRPSCAPTSSGRPRAGTRPASSPAPTRPTRSTARRSRSSSPTTC